MLTLSHWQGVSHTEREMSVIWIQIFLTNEDFGQFLAET